MVTATHSVSVTPTTIPTSTSIPTSVPQSTSPIVTTVELVPETTITTNVTEIVTAIEKGISLEDAIYDINGDGVINVQDAVLLRDYLLNKGVITDNLEKLDLNSNGTIDIFDYLRIEKKIID